jgi:hypothetical protein
MQLRETGKPEGDCFYSRMLFGSEEREIRGADSLLGMNKQIETFLMQYPASRC